MSNMIGKIVATKVNKRDVEIMDYVGDGNYLGALVELSDDAKAKKAKAKGTKGKKKSKDAPARRALRAIVVVPASMIKGIVE